MSAIFTEEYPKNYPIGKMLTASIRDVVRHPPFRMQKTPKGTFTVTERIKRVPFPSVTDAKGPLPTVGI